MEGQPCHELRKLSRGRWLPVACSVPGASQPTVSSCLACSGVGWGTSASGSSGQCLPAAPSSVGTFARALDCSSSVRQPSLHMSAAAASRDITLVSGPYAGHRHRWGPRLVPVGPVVALMLSGPAGACCVWAAPSRPRAGPLAPSGHHTSQEKQGRDGSDEAGRLPTFPGSTQLG